MKNNKIDFRAKARKHHTAAKQLIETNDVTHLRYASLELRMCIEALCYDRLQSYLKEVPNHVMRKWTPKQIISELLLADQSVEQTRSVWIGVEETPGVPAKTVSYLGTDQRFTLKWANSSHNALGNFLHTPTLDQVEKGSEPTAERMAVKIKDISTSLEAILASSIFNVNFGEFYQLQCECGFVLKRRREALSNPDGISCGQCKAIYDAILMDDGKVQFKIRRISYECMRCGAKNFVSSHLLKDGLVVSCGACGARSQAHAVFALSALEKQAIPSERQPP